MSVPRKPGQNNNAEHPVRDLLLIVGVLLAALQVIPIYVTSKGIVFYVILGVVVFCAVTFFFLRHVGRTRLPPGKVLIPVGLMLVASGLVLSSQVSLRRQITRLQEPPDKPSADAGLHGYLDAVFHEHSSQWNGEFEKRYARPTLYLLSDAGVAAKPTDVQNSIILWRSGSEGVGAYFMGVAGLAGETLPEATKDISRIAQRFMSYVQRPMADSDLLNRRTRETQSSLPSDDVPQRVLVLGDPASGKSSMLDRLDMIQARRARGSEEEAIPVLIKLKGLRDPSKAQLNDKIRERLGSCADVVLKHRNLVLLIDALDETGDPAKAAEVLAALLEEAPYKEGVDRVIVTGRVLNYSSNVHSSAQALRYKRFSTTILYGLDQTAIEKQILASPITSEQKAKIMEKLAFASTRAAWLQFLRMPMNFELISEIMGDLNTEDISQGQTEIIRRFVAHRFQQKAMPSADVADGMALLENIAINLLAEGVGGRSREFVAKDALTSRPAQRLDESQIEGVEQRLLQLETTGLIKQSGKGKYRFFHLNLQDYFAAVAMSNLIPVDPTDVAWRQIILFFAGRADGDKMLEVLNHAAERQPSAYLEELSTQVQTILTNSKVPPRSD